MSLEETKTFSFNLSPTLLWSILGIALSTLSTGGYFAITKYNQITELVDNYSPYNDAVTPPTSTAPLNVTQSPSEAP